MPKTANAFPKPGIKHSPLNRRAPVHKLWLNLDLPLFLRPFE